MIFLDFHPAAPNSAKAAKEQNTTRAKCAPQKNVTHSHDVALQMKWMEEYGNLRGEFQHRLQKSEEISKQRIAEIEVLTAKIAKRENQIRKLKMKCKSIEKATQTDKIETTENATQMEPKTDRIDASIQTECV